jgi:serine/threonine protein kinase
MQQQLGQDDRYRAVQRIDAGGMGEVWEAEDTLLGRRIAIKVLAEELADDPVAVRRFRREARATAMLNHPNVMGVFDFVEGKTPFLVMELLEGQTLAERLRDGALPPLEAAQIAADVADGLEAAHRAGIIHRDIKPGNIMLTPGGGVKVMDFGIAAAREAHSTTGQQLLATAAYAPPERITGGRASPAGDLYSLAVVLYEMLTGRPPFTADNAEALLRAHLQAEPRPVRERVFWVPSEIAAACEVALAKDPAARPASAGALAARPTVPEPTRRLSEDQTQVVDRRPRPRRPSRRVGTAAVMVVLLGMAGVAVGFWRTVDADRPRSVEPPATTVRRAPATGPATITVILRYQERVWTQCKVDGRLAFDAVGTPGEQRSWTARQRLDLALGNPTGVELVVDGQVLGRPNGHGQLWRGTFRPGRPPPPLG